MPTGKSRAENRAEMEREIRRLGRVHLSTHGAAGLSLRAIARDLGVVSSAVYRYVPSRDDLLTALVVEAYTDLADTVDAAIAAVPPDGHRDRVRACATAMRLWAVADAARWALLYGSPVPGYIAPAEQTVGPGTRVIGALLAELDAARQPIGAGLPAPTDDVARDLTAIRDEFGISLPDKVIAAATTLWATIIGGISLEVFGQYGTDTFAAPESLFTTQIDLTLSLIFD